MEMPRIEAERGEPDNAPPSSSFSLSSSSSNSSSGTRQWSGASSSNGIGGARSGGLLQDQLMALCSQAVQAYLQQSSVSSSEPEHHSSQAPESSSESSQPSEALQVAPALGRLLPDMVELLRRALDNPTSSTTAAAQLLVESKTESSSIIGIDATAFRAPSDRPGTGTGSSSAVSTVSASNSSTTLTADSDDQTSLSASTAGPVTKRQRSVSIDANVVVPTSDVSSTSSSVSSLRDLGDHCDDDEDDDEDADGSTSARNSSDDDDDDDDDDDEENDADRSTITSEDELDKSLGQQRSRQRELQLSTSPQSSLRQKRHHLRRQSVCDEGVDQAAPSAIREDLDPVVRHRRRAAKHSPAPASANKQPSKPAMKQTVPDTSPSRNSSDGRIKAGSVSDTAAVIPLPTLQVEVGGATKASGSLEALAAPTTIFQKRLIRRRALSQGADRVEQSIAMPPSSLANIDTRSQSSLKSTSFSVLNDGKDAGQPGSFLGSLAGGGPPGNRASTSSLTTTAASSGFSSGTVTGRLISATQSPSLPSLASLSSSSSTPTSLRVSQLSNAAIFKQRSYSSLLVDDDLNFEPIDEAELTALLRQVGRRPSVPNLVWQAAMANASKQHLGSSVAVTAAGSEASPLSPSAFASWPATSEMFSKPRSINSRSRSFGTQSVLSPLGTALATGPASGHPLASARMLERRPSLPFLSPAAQPFLPPSNLSSASSSSSIPVSSESAVQQSPPLLTTNSPPAAPTVVPSIAVAQASQQSLPAQSSQSLPAQPSQSPVPSAAGGRPAVTAGGVAPSLAVASLVKRNNVRQRSHSSGSSIPYTPSPLSSSAITPTATATASSPAPIAGPTSTSSSLPTASIPSEVTSSASKSASVNAVDVALDAPAFAAVRQAAAVPPTRTLSAPTMTALLPPVSNNAAVAMAVAASIALDREAAEAAEEENDDFGDTLTPSAPMHRTHVRTSSLAEQSGEDDDEELEEVLTPLVSAKSMRSQSMSIVPTPRETLQALQMHQSFDSLVISPSPSFPSFLGSSSRSSSSDSLMMRSLNNLNSSANDLTTVQATSPLVGATSLLGGSSTPVYPAPSSPYVARRTIREGWPVPTSSLRRDSHSFDSLSSHLSPNSSCSQLPLASSSSSSFSAYSSGASASQYNSDRYSSTGSDLERFEAVPLRFIFDRVFPAWVTEAPLGLDSSDSTAGASASNAGGLGGAIAFPPGSYSAPFVPADGGAGEMEIRPQDVLAGRYQVVELLDSAVFSRAYHCVDLTSGTPVCVKVLKKSSDAFSQGVEEVRLLKYLNAGVDVDAVHIVKLSDYFVYRGHLLVVCELLRHNLYQQMKLTRNAADPYFTLARLKQIAKQMLTALAFAHARGVIHADLKPENILLRSRSQAQVKLIDFGSSLFSPYASASDDPNKPSGSANLFPGVTDVNLNKQHYIQSRPYRAPEVILGLPFDGRIDVWSLGCVLAELFMGRVLFRSDSIATLLARMIACRGNIPSDMLQFGSAVSSYFVVRDGVPFLFDRRREKQSVPASPSKLLQASSAATATAVAAGGSGGMTTTTAAAAGGGGLLSPSSPHSPTAPAYLVRAVSRRLGDILQESGVHPNDQDDFSLFVDFLSTLLMIDPRQRPTARVAMRHAWFA